MYDPNNYVIYLESLIHRILKLCPEHLDYLNDTVESYNNKSITSFLLKEKIYSLYHEVCNHTDGKMQILICIDTLNGGGAEKLLIDLLEHFDENKFNIDLVILHFYGVYFDKIPEKINWFIGDTLIQDKKYDVEIAFLEGSATKYIYQRNRDAKKIAWVHTDLLNFHWTKTIYTSYEEEQKCYAKFDEIVFVSQESAKMFGKLFPDLDCANHKVIYNLIDKEKIETKAGEFNVGKKRFTLCSVGRLVPVKGYNCLLPVLSQLKKDGLIFDFWIVGGGYQLLELQSMVKEYDLEDVVYFMGFKPNPYPFIKGADVIVSSSFAEGYGLVISEALCLCKPIVATKTAGVTEILEGCGLLVEQSEDSLYKGLKKVIIDEKLRKMLAIKARARSQMFDTSQTMELIYSLFQ